MRQWCEAVAKAIDAVPKEEPADAAGFSLWLSLARRNR